MIGGNLQNSVLITNVHIATPLVSQFNVFVATSCDHIVRLPKFGITCCFHRVAGPRRPNSKPRISRFFGWRDDNIRGEEEVVVMEKASEELERRSRYLSSLIQQQKKKEEQAAAREAIEAMSLKTELEMKIANDDDDSKKIKKKKKKNVEEEVTSRKLEQLKVRIRACDMSPELQKRAFRCARDLLASMPKLDSKRLALTLKKEFDSSYGPAWHCIVGTSFGSYVTHSLGGFLYFSIDKVYILLFRTTVEPLGHH